MQLSVILSNYGYAALFVGTFLEGETILVLGGLAAHQRYLTLPGVIAAAFAGSLMGDQLFFYLGRRHRERILSRHPAWRPRFEKVQRLLDRNETLTILSFRFLYGLRTVTPFVLGASKVSYHKFAMLNATGALAWAAIVGTAGYFFGNAVETVIGEIKRYEILVFAIVIAGGAAIWLFRWKRHRQSARAHEPAARTDAGRDDSGTHRKKT